VSALTRDEALYSARKMLRGFAGAPDARQHAKRVYSELVHASGWSPTEEADILALGAWLQTRPSEGALKTRCAELLTRLR